MRTFALVTILIFIGFTELVAQDTISQDIVVKITNFDNDKGKALVGLYNTESDFLKNHYQSSSSKIDNNECTITFKDVPAGTYAISLIHDENNNGKMDTNKMGIPKEAYGCSNNARGFLGPPKWRDAKFEVKNEPIHLTIKL